MLFFQEEEKPEYPAENPLEQGENQTAYDTRGPFLESPPKFLGHKVILSSSVSEHGEVYAPETSCMNGTSVHM